jgi:hypothetical protein
MRHRRIPCAVWVCALITVAVSIVLYSQPAWSGALRLADSIQDQNKPAADIKTTSGEQGKGTQSVLKSAPSDEGQLATMNNARIPTGSKIYVAPMEGGFDNFVIAGFQKKQVPLVVVADPSKADYEISGIAESEKAGWAKMFFMGSQQSREQASVKIVDIKSGAVIFGYSVNKGNSYKGKQSAGEACAKHIKEIVVLK